jgi:hypothetical protein
MFLFFVKVSVFRDRFTLICINLRYIYVPSINIYIPSWLEKAA